MSAALPLAPRPSPSAPEPQRGPAWAPARWRAALGRAQDRTARLLGVRHPAAPAMARAAALDRRQLLLVAGVLVVALPLALMLSVDQPAARLFRDAPPALIGAMAWITEWGESQWYLVPSGVAALSLLALAPRLHGVRRAALRWLGQASLFVFANIALSGIAVNVIKVIIGRARPGLFFSDGAWGVEPLRFAYAYASFPSGHSATAFSLALAVGALARPALGWLLGFAALIALSRVAVTAHWVGDTVAGGGVALLTMLVVRHWFASHGLAFTIAADGHTRPDRAGRLVGAALARGGRAG